jgi:methionine synthase II (cobalamin-independent)
VEVWQDVKLSDDKLILPGVVSHATNVVEHPELVAERTLRFANLVGRERVIASTDCGLGGASTLTSPGPSSKPRHRGAAPTLALNRP